MSDMTIKNLKRIIPTTIFLLTEAFLYILILTTEGTILVRSSYLAIVLCFLYSLLHVRCGDRFIIGGLACTVVADFFLVVCSPARQLYGMIAFLIAQSLYVVTLQKRVRCKPLLIARIVLTILAAGVAIMILNEKTDPLALVSICYYANLMMNIVEAFSQYRISRLFPIGLVLFILCDTVIGLQVASGAYLPISEVSLIHRIIFMDFNLSWLFYLPSQVLISLGSWNNRVGRAK